MWASAAPGSPSLAPICPVGVGRVLGREDPTHLAPSLVHRDAFHPRVRPGQVHELEDAERRARAPGEAGRMQPSIVDPDQLTGLDLPDEGGPDDVEGAGLRGDDEALRKLPHRERTETARVS